MSKKFRWHTSTTTWGGW